MAGARAKGKAGHATSSTKSSRKSPEPRSNKRSERLPPEPAAKAPHRPIDDLDRRILAALSRNARQSARSVAREVNVSPGVVIDRIQSLEAQGTIIGYRTEVDPRKIGFPMIGFMCLELASDTDIGDFMDRVMDVSKVETVYCVDGRFDLLVTLRVENLPQFKSVRDRIRQLPGLARSESMVSLDHRRRPGGQFAFVYSERMFAAPDQESE